MQKRSRTITIIIMVTIMCVIFLIVGPKIIKYYKMQEIFALDEKFPGNTKEIKDFQVGASYSVILYEDGSVWVAGSNYYYLDGKIYGLQTDRFLKVDIEKVKQISVGSNFVLALTERGEIYSWGGNDYGQLGRKSGGKIDDTPQKLDLENIKEIYTVNSQAAALSNDNVAYYWGYASRSGDSGYDKILKIENEKITDIFLTEYSYFFKTEENQILGLGFNFDGVTDEKNGWATEPVKLDIANVSNIRHKNFLETFVIKEDGTAYILNMNESDELTKIESSLDIKDIYSFNSLNNTMINGDNEGYFIIDSDNKLYFENQCILENVKSIAEPKMSNLFGRMLILTEYGNVYNWKESTKRLIKNETDYKELLEKVDVQNIKFAGITDDYAILIDNNNMIYKSGKSYKGGLGIEENNVVADFSLENKGE